MRISYSRERLDEGFANVAKPRAPIATQRIEATPEEWVQWIRELALANESDESGFAEIPPEWSYEGFEIKERWIIVLGAAESYEAVATAPAHASSEEVLDQ